MRFQALLDDLLAETTRREPSYFTRFGVALPESGSVIGRYRVHPLLAAIPEADLAAAFAAATRYLEAKGVKITTGEGDPLGHVIAFGFLD